MFKHTMDYLNKPPQMLVYTHLNILSKPFVSNAFSLASHQIIAIYMNSTFSQYLNSAA